MRFLDSAKVFVKSGDGGNGSSAFRREKFLEFGGPAGGMTEELSRSLGLDSFSIGQGELNSTTRARSSRVLGSGQTVSGGPSVSGQVLSLGKRLGPDLFLNFEQSLGGAATLVKLTYQISRRLSVIARGGTDTALDVQYGFSFR